MTLGQYKYAESIVKITLRVYNKNNNSLKEKGKTNEEKNFNITFSTYNDL